MLTSLTIKNYALIDDLNMSFNKGLSIITGETGAGKSILLGGLSLVLGKRADLSAIKDSSKKCVIETTFNISQYNLHNFFSNKELDFETNTIIRREILPSGKSRAFINDTPVNLQIVQELGSQLLDIHSQNKTLELTEDNFQFQLIDALADNYTKLSDYRVELLNYKKLNKILSELLTTKSELIKEYDYNSFLFQELSEANLEVLDLSKLEEELETLANVETIQEKLGSAYQLISAEDVGANSTLEEVQANLSKIATYSTRYNELSERIRSLNIELNDIVGEMEDLQANLDADPLRLEVVNQKLTLLNALFHKHQVNDVSELIIIRDALDAKIVDSDDIDDKIIKLEKQIEKVRQNLEMQANSLHSRRIDVIPDLISQLEVILTKLGMPNARFKIEMASVKEFNANGTDALNFLFSANKGGQFNELKRAASGGELSRIMLAIKSIVSKYVQLPTIIFDEIDTGVSGEISNKMAVIMQDMSNDMQVISITHLPQIAAKGNFHFKVYKKDVNEMTNTYMKELNEDERIVEIAEMLGGADLSNSAIAHAKQLLN